MSLMKEFESAHKRHHAERERFDACSLREVIQRLKGEPPRYDDGFKVLVLGRERARNRAVAAASPTRPGDAIRIEPKKPQLI